MPRVMRSLLLLGLASGLLACGAPTPRRTPPAYPSATTSRILDDPTFYESRTLTEALRIDPGGSEAQMAGEFARRIDRATARCAIRKISHEPGSSEVGVDLGVGCKAGAGSMTVRFSRIDDGIALLDFSFRDFYQDANLLDGDVSAEIADGRVFTFGHLPWKALDPPSVWSPPPRGAVASASAVNAGLGRFVGDLLIHLLLLPLVIPC